MNLANSRRAYLEQSVYLLAPTLGTWSGTYHLPRAQTETTVSGAAVTKQDITTPQAKLITDTYPLDSNGVPWKKRLSSLHLKLTKSKSRYSVPFSITGVRIVPKTKLPDMLKELYGDTVGDLKRELAEANEAQQHTKAAKLESRLRLYAGEPDESPIASTEGATSVYYDLMQIRKEFVNSWDSIVAQLKQNSSVFEQVKSKVPSAKTIGSKFYLDVTPIELTGGGGRETDVDELLSNQRYIQDACARRIDEAIEEIMEGPRRELTDALLGLEELVAREGRLTARSFTAVTEAVNKMKVFDFSLTPEMLQRVNAVEKLVKGAHTHTLNSAPSVARVFQKELENVRTAINADTAVAAMYDRFGSAPRILEV